LGHAVAVASAKVTSKPAQSTGWLAGWFAQRVGDQQKKPRQVAG